VQQKGKFLHFTSGIHEIVKKASIFHRQMGLAASILVTSLLSTPLMVVQMALLQLVAGDQQGLPTIRYKTFIFFTTTLFLNVVFALGR
jgi:hypothetical protein